MTVTLAQIWRHPIKAIGRESLGEVRLSAGHWLPFDRLWAVTHERSRLDGSGWEKKINFLRGVTDPNLMAVTAKLDEANGILTLDHPEAGTVSFDPDKDDAPFLDWVGAVWSSDLPAPTAIYRAENAHLTDVPDAWVSVASLASNDDLSERMGQTLSPERWRANLWLEGLTPWEEKDWPGKTVRIGGVDLRVEREITRCKATMANPETGRRDADTLGALNDLGHQEFGLYASVMTDGTIRCGDPVHVQ